MEGAGRIVSLLIQGGLKHEDRTYGMGCHQ